MHELGIVFHVMDTLDDVAKDNGLTQIQSVTLEIGEVSIVVGDYLIDCWQWAAKKRPLFENSKLLVQTLEAVTHCDGCGKDYGTVAHGRICPYCGSEKTWLIKGNELNIKEISAI